MKWVLTTPEIEIHPRESSSTIIAYVVRSRPIPPYSSGIVTPNRPSSFICSTTSSGNLSSWSNSSATGMISLSTNWRTISVIAFCSSVCSWWVAVARAMAPALRWLVRGVGAAEDTAAPGPSGLLPGGVGADLDAGVLVAGHRVGQRGLELEPGLPERGRVVDEALHGAHELLLGVGGLLGRLQRLDLGDRVVQHALGLLEAGRDLVGLRVLERRDLAADLLQLRAHGR